VSWVKTASIAYWLLFVGTFLAVAVWESFRPKIPLSAPVEHRWGRHALLLAICAVIQKVVLSVSPLVVAAGAAGSHFGVLNRPWMPYAFRCLATVLLLDLVEYFVHRAFHGVHFLWRVHEVHHSDPDFDVSTAGRFHPMEVLTARAANLAAVALLAPPVVAVVASELLTVVLNLFTHANAALPRPVEKLLRSVFITPDLHRIHHSLEYVEQQTNFGQTFSWWDRLFGTYLGQPAAGEAGIVTGVEGTDSKTSLRLRFLLAQPFQSR
jgi:sterol desaturase/sphingolipid hydroxylase (fatty acid hydroxylase superfamily)